VLVAATACRKDKGGPVGPGTDPANYPIVSTFDKDLEGWGAFNDGQLNWEPTGGNPGGYARGVDLLRAEAWYFSAPSRYLGNVSGAFGRWLAFDLYWSQPQPGNPIETHEDVILVSDRLSLVARYPNDPGSTWGTFRFRLDETGGWMVQATGAPATRAEVEEVLGKLRQIYIRGEFRDNAEQAGLDNFKLGAES
jgi:hypothetical protein